MFGRLDHLRSPRLLPERAWGRLSPCFRVLSINELSNGSAKMSMIGAVITPHEIILVEGVIKANGTVVVFRDESLALDPGDRRRAYARMAVRVRARLATGVDTVILKASANTQFSATTATLHATELRGVFLSAVPEEIEVVQRMKRVVSNRRPRKVDDYLKDDAFFKAKFRGRQLRRSSREAAFFILNELEEF